MKTVEGLLEKGLIEVANKQEELKVCVFLYLESILPHAHVFSSLYIPSLAL